MAEAPTPLDLILSIAQNANTEYARDIFGSIRKLLDTGAAVEPWTSAVQLARDLGAVGPTESYYLIDLMIEAAIGALTGSDEVLIDLSAQMEAVERAHGLEEDEDFHLDDAPPEWTELNRRWDRRFQDLHVDLLRRIGEPGMANAFVLRPDDHAEKVHEGWGQLLEVGEEEQEA